VYIAYSLVGTGRSVNFTSLQCLHTPWHRVLTHSSNRLTPYLPLNHAKWEEAGGSYAGRLRGGCGSGIWSVLGPSHTLSPRNSQYFPPDKKSINVNLACLSPPLSLAPGSDHQTGACRFLPQLPTYCIPSSIFLMEPRKLMVRRYSSPSLSRVMCLVYAF